MQAPQRLTLEKIDSSDKPVPSSPTPQPEPSKKLSSTNSTKNRDNETKVAIQKRVLGS